jgi:hypothetical protein
MPVKAPFCFYSKAAGQILKPTCLHRNYTHTFSNTVGIFYDKITYYPYFGFSETKHCFASGEKHEKCI